MREPVSYQEIPKRVIDATVAAEDKRFWEHSGVDVMGIVRAVWINLRSGQVEQGGSTITQQVAKRLLTSGERSFRRKIEDACLALQIERQYSKEQIIELYLNQVYYGSQAYGIKAAAEIYFGRPLDQLSLSQIATLARLPRRPSQDNPFVSMDAAIANRNTVLQIMLDEGMIDQQAYDTAINEKLRLVSAKPISQVGIRHAPYFTTWVLDNLREKIPSEDYARGGYKIYTTLNYKAQKEVEDGLASTIRSTRRRGVTEGAMVVMDTNGEIVAMVGGNDFDRSQYNVVTQGHRQPGSSFKPFVYSTAIELGTLRPNGSVSNAAIHIKTPSGYWSPKGGGHGGSVSVWTAFTQSINVPAVHVCMDVGPENVVRVAKEVFGFKSDLFPGPALALGSSAVSPLEMAQGYSVFATGGNRATPFGIRRIVGPDGGIVAQYRPLIAQNVLSPATTDALRTLMRGVVTSGTGRAASSVPDARGKTGTTNSHKDAWFCGYTDHLIGIVWVANARYDGHEVTYGPMAGVFGGQVPAALWAKTMGPLEAMFADRPAPNLDGEKTAVDQAGRDGFMMVRICRDSGLRARRNCPYFLKRMTAEAADDLEYCQEEHRPGVARNDDEAPPVTDENSPPGPNDDAPVPPTPPRIQPPRATTESSTISVEICVETGLRATTYCPQKRVEKFKRGSEPSDFCHVHHP
jgi:penicillin-binding protein 1A